MIRLPEGTQKFLLLDHYEIARNSERNKAGSPVAVVVERTVVDGVPHFKRHVGYQVLTNSPVTLAYVQRGVVCPNHNVNRRVDERAAYTTWGEVVITTSPDEAAVLETEPPAESEKPAAEKAPEPNPKAKKSNG